MKKILVAPLNWGLGHAARCIPLIEKLLEHGADVSIASDGNSLSLLKEEFPQLPFFSLPSYNITYSGSNNQVFKMAGNFFNMQKAIDEEHKQMLLLQQQHSFDAVISDNRYGVWHPSIKSIFITHQINIKVPAYLKWIQPALLNFHLKKISNFNECWIPDVASSDNLSGELSHNCKLPDNTYYIGWLSRFSSNFSVENKLAQVDQLHLPETRFQLLIILSGPEPQRTLLEQMLLKQIIDIKQQILIVQGISGKQNVQQVNEYCWMINFMTAEQLKPFFHEADIIVSRSGYSTIMDLVVTGKKAILIPTPGQTEQEYLAEIFKQRNIYFSRNQDTFRLDKALEEAVHFKGMIKQNDQNVLNSRVAKLLE